MDAENGMSRRNFFKLAGASLGAAGMMMFLGGCGEDAASGGAGASAASDAGAAGGSKDIKIVVSNQNKPFCYLDSDGTTITGYDVESIKLCNEKLGNKYNIKWEAMDFNTMISSLQSGACDMVSCCLVQNDSRRESYLFPEESYLLAPMALLTRPDSDIKSMEDMAGKTIITSPVTYEYGMLKAYNDAHPELAIVFKEVDSATMADDARMVANGQADASLIYISSFDSYVEAGGVELAHTDVVLTESNYYMLAKKNTELAEDMSRGLKMAKEDKSLNELSTKWFGEDVFTKYADALTDNMILAEGAAAAAASSKADAPSSSKD